MKRLAVVGLAAALAAGVAPSVARAQIVGPNPVRARALERLHADGVDIPEARVLFFQDEQGDPCVALGIKEGPGELRPGFLIFEARPAEGSGGRPQRLKFEFDKQQVRTENGLRLWDSCLPEGDELHAGDQLQITVRRPRRKTQAFVVEMPAAPMAGGIDLWNTGEGELKSTVRITPLGEDAG